MKKLVTLLLSLALVLSLAACGGEATPDASDDAPASSQNEESTENDNTENQIVFEEVVAIDNAECAVKITEIDPDNMWGYTLKAQLENKSTEKTYMFSVESASINGVQCDPMFASEVAAGKKANEEINFSTDTLEENGIVEYTDIELTFKVYDSNDWSADPVGKETIHVYPYGEENAVAFVREAQATDNVIIDNDYVTVIVTGYCGAAASYDGAVWPNRRYGISVLSNCAWNNNSLSCHSRPFGNNVRNTDLPHLEKFLCSYCPTKGSGGYPDFVCVYDLHVLQIPRYSCRKFWGCYFYHDFYTLCRPVYSPIA